MKHPRFAIIVMAAVHLLLFILLWWTSWLHDSCLAIFVSQGVLLGLWAALGGKPTAWRATFVVIVAATLGWLTNGLRYSAISIATIFVTGQAFLVMGILLPARLMGLRLSKGEAEDHLGHLQFSVGQALSWMTALAVFMSATHYLRDCFAGYLHFDRNTICFLISDMAVGLAATWLICGNRWIAPRCFTLLLIIGLGTAWIVRDTQLDWWPQVYLLGCEAAVTAASLAVVRLAGYRLVWHWPFRRSQP